MSNIKQLKEKYRAKVKELDTRMEELKAMEFNDEVYEEMNQVMAQTNHYLRILGADADELYDK